MTLVLEQPAPHKMGEGFGHSASDAQKFSAPPLFAARVALVGTTGAHVRFVPGALAESMVADGSAKAAPAGGKVREVTWRALQIPTRERIGASRRPRSRREVLPLGTT